jgi:small-conductance mechanosensitive channel
METLWKIAQEIGDQLVLTGSVLLRVVISFGVAWIVSRLARQQLEPRLARQKYGRDGAIIVGRLISIAAYVLAFISVLNQMHVNWTGILTLLSAFTVAIGLSLQDVLKSFFSGILMLLERPFSVGDRVKVRDYEGEIQGIDIRTTLIRNRDGALIHVPNSIMFGEILTNRSHFRTRRLDLTISDETRPVRELEEIVQRTVQAIPDVRKPVAHPRIVSIKPDGVILQYSFLVQANLTVDREITMALAGALQGASIEVNET